MSRRRDGEGVSPRLRVRRSLWARSVDASVRNSVDSRIGRGMDAVRERRALLREEAGHGLVRRQHEFFDQPVREQPDAPLDALHFACGTIHDELRLGQIEIKAPPRLTPFEQKMRQRFGVL